MKKEKLGSHRHNAFGFYREEEEMWIGERMELLTVSWKRGSNCTYKGGRKEQIQTDRFFHQIYMQLLCVLCIFLFFFF